MTQQTQNKQLPKGWKEEKLDELFEILGGDAAPKGDELSEKGEVDFVRMQDLGRVKDKIFISDVKDHVTKQTIEKKKLKIFKKGSILIPRSGSVHLNHRAMLSKDSCVVSHIVVLQTKKPKDYNNMFLFYLLNTIDMRKIMHQTTGLNLIRFSDLKELEVNVTENFLEQSEIVSAIETQFTRLDEAVKNLKAVKEKLEIYRKAVLKKAFEKKEGWGEKELGILVSTRKEKSNPQKFKEEKYIGMAHVESDSGNVIEEHLAGEMKATSANFYRGDVLYGRLRPYLNKVVDADFKGLCSTEFIILIPNKEIYYKFVGWRLRSKDFVDFSNSLNNGDRPRVKFSQISKFKVYIPRNEEEQCQIVSSIESKFSIIDKVEKVVEESLLKAEKLRKSILKSAFDGKLVKNG